MSNEILKKSFLDRATNFIKKNNKTLITLLVVGFVFLFAFLILNHIDKKKNIEIAEQYSQALVLVKQKKINESKKILENIINKEHKFYSPLALYLIIEKNIEVDSLKVINFFSYLAIEDILLL